MEEHSKKWVQKHEIPEKIPGCQDTSQLHRLEKGKTYCEGKKCFYYTCRQCMPTLILDEFNPGYKTELHVVPRVSSIKKPALFTEDHGYHGEMVEFYANYMERVDSLSGIAVNGWSNQVARKIFDGVEKTFERKNSKQKSQKMESEELEKKMETWKKQTKPRENLESEKIVERKRSRSTQKRRTKEKTGLSERSKSVGSPSKATPATKNIPRDFEIDWILFNGSTITVVEVGEEGSNEKGGDLKTNTTEWKKISKIVPEKIKQIKKDQVIMKQLLTAVYAPEVTVNYLLVYPNLSMLEIKKELIQCRFFEKMTKRKTLVNSSRLQCLETHLELYEKKTAFLTEPRVFQSQMWVIWGAFNNRQINPQSQRGTRNVSGKITRCHK